MFTNEYFFFAGYVVLQFIVLATAWNILGGYTGYINFGSGAFFAIGAYTSVVLHKLPANADRYLSGPCRSCALIPAAVPVLILLGGIVAGHRRPRHGLSDPAAARRVLRDRHAGAWRSCCRR